MAQGLFLKEVKKGQAFTMPGSPFPHVIYRKGTRVPSTNYFYVYWEWEGEKKRAILGGYKYCLLANV